MNKLIQVLYLSKISKEVPPFSVDDILSVSRKNNQLNEVTGILLSKNGEFLQLLEGEELNVHYTLKKIRDDKRHKDFKIVHEGEIQKKLFDNWSMAHKESDVSNKELNSSVDELLQSKSISSNLELIGLLNKFYY